MWMSQHARGKRAVRTREKIGECARNAVRQMLRLTIPGYIGLGRAHRSANPFESQAPGFISYPTDEKGLRRRSLDHYQSHLGQFAAYLARIGLRDLAHLPRRC